MTGPPWAGVNQARPRGFNNEETMTCKECHHRPSERITDCGGYFAECTCACHDVADTSPELLHACELLHTRLHREQGGREHSEWEAPLRLLSDVIAKAKGKAIPTRPAGKVGTDAGEKMAGWSVKGTH